MSIDFYNQNAEKFIQDTLNVDMQGIYQRFFEYLPEGALILDAGCGSGRDSLAFLERGYQVEAFDASDEMVNYAKRLTGLDVSKRSFDAVDDICRFDGIWACASLLHVQRNGLCLVLEKLLTALKKNGVIYTSFKYGEGDREKGGRHFTDMTETCLGELIAHVDNVEMISLWTTDDARPDRDDKWLNVILKKV